MQKREYTKLLRLLESSGLKAVGKAGRRHGEITVLVHSPLAKLNQLGEGRTVSIEDSETFLRYAKVEGGLQTFDMVSWLLRLFDGKTSYSPPTISSDTTTICLSDGPYFRWWSRYFPRHFSVETSRWDLSPP
jgi:hypothetical protein